MAQVERCSASITPYIDSNHWFSTKNPHLHAQPEAASLKWNLLATIASSPTPRSYQLPIPCFQLYFLAKLADSLQSSPPPRTCQTTIHLRIHAPPHRVSVSAYSSVVSRQLHPISLISNQGLRSGQQIASASLPLSGRIP